MQQKLINTVQSRIKAMLQDPKIIELLNTFSTPEAAHEYLIKAAIATLIIPVNQR